MAARKKIQSKTTSKGRKNLQEKSKQVAQKTVPKKKPGRKPGPKPTKKIPTGYTLLKRDEKTLVKSYAVLEKKFDSFAEKLNNYCYENGDKMKAAVEANKSIMEFNKQTSVFRKALMKSKQGLKPIYTQE
jgi:hypothetical protein